MTKLSDLTPGAIFRPGQGDNALHMLCEQSEIAPVPAGNRLCVRLHDAKLLSLTQEVDVVIAGDVLDILMQ